jgi:hypothetical protein
LDLLANVLSQKFLDWLWEKFYVMIELPEYFVLVWEGKELNVQQRTIKGRKVFQISFPDAEKDLFIHRATIASGKKMWMSIPEGRQEQAIPIGEEIIKFYRRLEQQQTEK